MPVVSVVTAVYNGERYLAETIESLRRQTLSDLELIFVDDGSTDRTTEVIEQAREADPRVHLLRPGRVGQAAAFNIGIDAARGVWVARCDADDLAVPGRLASQVAFLERHPEVGICGSAAVAFGCGPEQLLTFPEGDDGIRSHLVFHSCLCHSAVVFRRPVLDAIRYRAEFGEACDYDLWAQAAWAGIRLHNLPDPLVRYRLHAQSVTHATRPRQHAFAQAIRRWQLERMGVSPTDAELDIHAALGNYAPGRSEEFVLAARAWLEKLLAAPGRAELPRIFHAVLGDYWYFACAANHELGAWVRRHYADSPLGKGRYYRWMKLRLRRLAAAVRRP